LFCTNYILTPAV